MTDTTAHRATTTPGGRSREAPGGVAAALAELRLLAAGEPARAQTQTWDWMLELGARRQLDDLRTLLALGTAPHELDGPTEGAYLALASKRLTTVLRPVTPALLRQWHGKSLDHPSNTGGNLVTPRLRRTLELLRVGADFETRIASGVAGSAPEVLQLDYSRGHGNGPLLGRVLDEVVEIVPDTYLLHGMWRSPTHGLITLGYFALRQPPAHV